jgi:hypothetical protein
LLENEVIGSPLTKIETVYDRLPGFNLVIRGVNRREAPAIGAAVINAYAFDRTNSRRLNHGLLSIRFSCPYLGLE